MRGASSPPGSAIIRALRWLAPHAAREEWCDEWTAELAHCDAPAWRCRLRATGALFDALWLRRHGDHAHLGSTMFAHDVRYATRTLLRRPLFTTIVVATLATCIGASSAVFSIVNGVLLHGLAYRDQGSLVAVWSDNPREKTDRYEVSVGDYLDWR